jgi:hypothetical protein
VKSAVLQGHQDIPNRVATVTPPLGLSLSLFSSLSSSLSLSFLLLLSLSLLSPSSFFLPPQPGGNPLPNFK